MANQAKRASTAVFTAGLIALALGIVASVLYGDSDSKRLFLCSTLVLAIAWVLERASKNEDRSAGSPK
ncbi:hypothetical protein GTY67_22335 [Streptomyces sp. SID8374]|uniref:hypothetical protein n=1 Tax=Streptomyces sp. SID8374 TaxID=2690354 RepID=UPI0013704004|nr:hypothetical protein [Streptomyces sp. SID8374]MYX16097.1 hypothetical protein [Streptomyces sp. SID8374]